jgi:hypothetical protein
MGLDAQSLVREFPRLVAVDIAGYGQDTAYRDMRAYDLLVQAEAGLCSVTGLPDAPAKVGVSAADIATGMNAHALILEALIARGRSGVGQAIEVAMFDAIADWMSVPLLHWTSAGRDTARHGMSHAAIYPYAPFRCRDGEVIVAIQQPAEWRRFCSGVLGQAELAEDKRFATNPDRLTHRAELAAIIAALFSSMTCADAAALLDAHAAAVEEGWAGLDQLACVAAAVAQQQRFRREEVGVAQQPVLGERVLLEQGVMQRLDTDRAWEGRGHLAALPALAFPPHFLHPPGHVVQHAQQHSAARELKALQGA